MRIQISKGRAALFGGTAVALVAGTVLAANVASAATVRGTVDTGTNGATLSVRKDASTSSTKTGRLADGTRVSIVCYKVGETISGTRGTTARWGKLSSGGYVSQAYVRLSESPSKCGSTSVAPGTAKVATANGSGLYVRSAPRPDAAQVDRLSAGQVVTVKCQATGASVSGTQGTTSLWNKLGDGRYATAAYMKTGTVSRCSGTTPTPTPTPPPSAGFGPVEKHPQALGYSNGRLPDSALCATSQGGGGYRLYCPAVDSFEAMNKAFKARFGKRLAYTDAYRSYAAQEDCRRRKGNLCAVPGTSNHGWALAIDFASNVNSFHTAEHKWMRANAPKYGWVLPSWAKETGSKPEPWHWERTYRDSSGRIQPSH